MAMTPSTFSQAATFSRPVTADYEDAQGVIQTAGIDVPRRAFKDGVFEGLLLDSLLDETLTLQTIEDFSETEGAFVLTGEFENTLFLPGCGFNEILTGTGTIGFWYENGIGKCYADGRVLFTVDPLVVQSPTALVEGGTAKIKEWVYLRNQGPNMIGEMTRGSQFTRRVPTAMLADFEANRYAVRNTNGALVYRTYDQVFSNTRNTPGSVLGANGVTTVGVDQPVLNEQGQDLWSFSTTNELSYSEDFSQWNAGEATTVDSSTDAQFGNCFDVTVGDPSIGYSGIVSSALPTLGGPHLRACLVKSLSGDSVIRIATRATDNYSFYYSFDTETGNVINNTSSRGISADMQDLGEGWWLLTCVMDSSQYSNTHDNFVIGVDAQSSFRIKLAQAEYNTRMGPYVFTNGSAQTRDPDMMRTLGTLSEQPWWSVTENTMILDFTPDVLERGASYLGGETRRYFRIVGSNGGSDHSLTVYDGDDYIGTGQVYVPGRRVKVAVSLNESEMAYAVTYGVVLQRVGPHNGKLLTIDYLGFFLYGVSGTLHKLTILPGFKKEEALQALID